MVSVALARGINRRAFLSPTAERLPFSGNARFVGFPPLRDLASYTLMLVHSEESEMKRSEIATPRWLIHPSAWNRNSANFAMTEFSEVPHRTRTIRLYGRAGRQDLVRCDERFWSGMPKRVVLPITETRN